MSRITSIIHRLSLGLLLTLASPLLFANSLLLNDEPSKLSGLHHIQYLIDPAKDMAWQDATTSQRWQPLSNGNLGYVKNPVWTYISLQNTSHKTLNIVLYNPRAGMDHIHVHILKDNQPIDQWLLGDLYPTLNHPIVNRYSAIPFVLKPNQHIIVLSQLKNTGPIEANWIIRSTAEFAYLNIQENLLWGILIGLALMLMIYHVNLFFTLKVPSLLIFVGMIIFVGVTQLSFNGFLRNNDWLESWQQIINLASWVTYILSLILSAWFAISFMNTRKTMPVVHKALLMLIGIEMLVLLFFLYAIFFNQTLLSINSSHQLIAIASMLIPFLAGVIAQQRNLPGATYFLLSQVAAVMASSVQTATLIGLIEITRFSAMFPALAYITHMIFIALAIGQRLSMTQQQSHKQHELLVTQSRLSDIGQTFGNITHQAKLPLARLGSQISLMQALNQQPSEAHYQRMQMLLPSMRDQLDLLQTTVEDFRQFYTAPLRIENISLDASIKQVLDLLSGKMLLSRTEVKFVTPHKDLKISTDGGAFSHVMMILLDNAFDILLDRKIENSTLSIGYGIDQDEVIIWVRDQAGGIKIKPIERIFENFVSDKKQAGTGIGLCVAKLMVEERLQGRIRAANISGGAQFTLWLHDLSLTRSAQTPSHHV